MSFLTALPPELVGRIATYLSPDELGDLRLVSRELCEKARYEYEERVLRQRWMMSDDSLGTLGQILKHARLGTRYTDLRISPHFLSEYTGREKSGEQYKLWRGCMGEQQTFLNSSRPAALMTSALERMSSLRTVEVGQWCEPGKPYDCGYGGNFIEFVTESRLDPYFNEDCEAEDFDEEEHDLGSPIKFNQNITFNFNTLLTALSVAQRPIESLAAHQWTECEGFADDLRGVDVTMLQPFAQKLGGSSHFRDGLEASLASLKHLRLVVEYERADHDSHVNKQWIQWLVEFVELAPQLQKLCLYFDGLDFERLGGNSNRFAFLCFTTHAHMEHLTHLELANGPVQSDALYNFLCKHWPKLKHISLRRIALDHVKQGKKDWPAILRGLNKLDSISRALHLGCLYEADGRFITFLPNDKDDCPCQNELNHQSGIFRFSRCKHMVFETEDGRLPSDVSKVKRPTSPRGPALWLA